MPMVNRQRPIQREPIEAVCPTCQLVVRGIAVNGAPSWDSAPVQGSWSSCTEGNDRDIYTGWVCPTLESVKRSTRLSR